MTFKLQLNSKLALTKCNATCYFEALLIAEQSMRVGSIAITAISNQQSLYCMKALNRSVGAILQPINFELTAVGVVSSCMPAYQHTRSPTCSPRTQGNLCSIPQARMAQLSFCYDSFSGVKNTERKRLQALTINRRLVEVALPNVRVEIGRERISRSNHREFQVSAHVSSLSTRVSQVSVLCTLLCESFCSAQ